jgi:heme/copper-type cytochrome/quinol oxidase subunit 4
MFYDWNTFWRSIVAGFFTYSTLHLILSKIIPRKDERQYRKHVNISTSFIHSVISSIISIYLFVNDDNNDEIIVWFHLVLSKILQCVQRMLFHHLRQKLIHSFHLNLVCVSARMYFLFEIEYSLFRLFYLRFNWHATSYIRSTIQWNYSPSYHCIIIWKKPNHESNSNYLVDYCLFRHFNLSWSLYWILCD